MSTTQERIAKLERELAALKAEEAKKHPPSKPVDEPRGVTITTSVPQSSLIVPSDDELIRLAVIGIAAFPQFGPKYELGLTDRIMHHRFPNADIKPDRERIDVDFRGGFKRAFLAAGAFYRTAEPCRTRFISHWADQANTWLRSYGLPEIETNMLLLACVCHGDIPYTVAGGGAVWELGVDVYSGKSAGDAWRGVLSSGSLRSASKPALPLAQRSPSRVFGGSY